MSESQAAVDSTSAYMASKKFISPGPGYDLPASLTVVNENTPLIPANQKAARVARHRRSSLSLSVDHDHRKREIRGLVLMTLSALFFSLMSLCVKLGGVRFPSFEMVFARSFIQLVLGLMFCAWKRINPLGNKEVRGWLLLRGLAGSIGLALFFYSITQLPLADATVVFFLGPTFTAILAALVLRESFTFFDFVCSFVCMVGVVFVSKPRFLFSAIRDIHPLSASSSSTFDIFTLTETLSSTDLVDNEAEDLHRFLAVLAALGGAFMSAVAYVTVRKVGKGAHFMVHVVYFGAIACILSPIGLVTLQKFVMPTQWQEWVTLVACGITAFLGQCLLNQGLQLAPAGPGTLMRMNDIVFAFLFGITILHEVPDAYALAGAFLITGCTTSMGIHKWVHRRNPTSATQDRLERGDAEASIEPPLSKRNVT